MPADVHLATKRTVLLVGKSSALLNANLAKFRLGANRGIGLCLASALAKRG